ncbi:MAG: hypothetical protein GC181_08500 [Bacteroidetes bacterium]|nr:hypothetical protein [Bacteroidota bacterium]
MKRTNPGTGTETVTVTGTETGTRYFGKERESDRAANSEHREESHLHPKKTVIVSEANEPGNGNGNSNGNCNNDFEKSARALER